MAWLAAMDGGGSFRELVIATHRHRVQVSQLPAPVQDLSPECRASFLWTLLFPCQTPLQPRRGNLDLLALDFRLLLGLLALFFNIRRPRPDQR
jgi:hypothetical protein